MNVKANKNTKDLNVASNTLLQEAAALYKSAGEKAKQLSDSKKSPCCSEVRIDIVYGFHQW
jgi:hypothetical protein